MTSLEHVDPEAVGLSSERLDLAQQRLQELVEEGVIPAASTAIGRRGKLALSAAYGRRGPEDDSPRTETDTIFLLASLTKPVVCAGIMLLIQQGRLCLDQPVVSLVPEFGKEKVLVRHLMTHTSGLPDQLSNNVALRTRHAPLADFIDEVCALELRFPPGTKVSYQSMGILMLQEIAERITGQRLLDWLRERLFLPLGMEDTTLGMPDEGLEGTAWAFPSGNANYGDEEVDWGWNSPYWRDLGAPWGGLHATAEDLSLLLAHMLDEIPGPLSAAARRAMTRDQIAPLPHIPPAQKLTQRWGLGWMLGAPPFGDLTSPRTFGHTGATGTLYWADPESGLTCVLLTNQPRERRHLFARYSNAVAA
jgi:CubicO group peptidase (beta-lactamase class C family)